MDYKMTLFTVEDGVGWITMNSPKNMNAINTEMAAELSGRLTDCEENPEVKIIVLSGGDKFFSAGGDIGYFYKEVQSGSYNVDSLGPLFLLAGHIMAQMKAMSKLIITSVTGAAAGAGANLALGGDFTIAAENAKFIEAFSGIGLAPDTGGMYILPRLIGSKRALELCVTGRPLGAEEALSLGAINRVCPKESLKEETLKFAKMLAKGPTVAYGAIKKQAFASEFADLLAYVDKTEGPQQDICAATDDFKEGITAFVEKRRPKFQGK